MCMDVPARVVEVDLDGAYATADSGGKNTRVSLVMLDLMGKHVRSGDWLSVNAGIAVRVLTDAEAMETLHRYEEMQGERS